MPRPHLGVILSLGLLLLGASELLASEPASANAAAEKNPFDFLKLERWDLGLWTLVVFGLLMVILGRFAWKPIMEGLDKREQTLASTWEEAEKAKSEAQAIRAQLQQELADANAQIRAMLEEARRDADTLRTSARSEGAAEAKAELDRARREIETARDQALQELWASSVQLASMISSKAIRRELTADDHRRLFDEALSEIQAAKSAGAKG
ncbi:F0F1 ATP synthase subunit B [Tuwongella immobilis]|nr:F0F1 ATP synthase subunit B [Tuwongella immobilis]